MTLYVWSPDVTHHMHEQPRVHYFPPTTDNGCGAHSSQPNHSGASHWQAHDVMVLYQNCIIIIIQTSEIVIIQPYID